MIPENKAIWSGKCKIEGNHLVAYTVYVYIYDKSYILLSITEKFPAVTNFDQISFYSTSKDMMKSFYKVDYHQISGTILDGTKLDSLRGKYLYFTRPLSPRKAMAKQRVVYPPSNSSLRNHH